MKIKHTIEINSYISTVFEYLENIEKQKLWIKNLVKIEYHDPSQKKFQLYLKEGYKIKQYNGITKEAVKPYLLHVILYNKQFSTETIYKLEKNGDNTILFYEVKVHFKSVIMKAVAFLFFLFSLFMVKTQLQQLKKVVEKANNNAYLG
jgi:hypothetical protein